MTNKSKDWKPWLGNIDAMSDAQIDHIMGLHDKKEHAGYDHKGIWRECIQEIHFCIDDYGEPESNRDQ